MTDNEIVKALECCVNGERGNKCRGCEVATGCKTLLLRESLDLIKSQKAEIERFADIGKMYSEVRAEAIKEFAERLKENADVYDDDEYYFHFVTTEDINNLVKEMTEETK